MSRLVTRSDDIRTFKILERIYQGKALSENDRQYLINLSTRLGTYDINDKNLNYSLYAEVSGKLFLINQCAAAKMIKWEKHSQEVQRKEFIDAIVKTAKTVEDIKKEEAENDT